MSSLETFGRELDAELKKKLTLASKVVRKVAFNGHRNIVKSTPLDTGRARANWQIDLNGTNETDIESLLPPDGERAKLNNFKLGDVIHIFNNVEYIIPLEYGLSNQAPSGWVRSEAIRMDKKLSQAFKAI